MDVQQAGAKRRTVETEILDANKERLHADLAALKVGDPNMDATAEPATKIRPLDPARFGQAEHKRNDFVIFLPVDQPYEDVFQLDFWKSIARADKVHAGDKIVVMKDDISLVAELVVRESIGKHARIVVGEVSKTVFPPVIQDAGDDEQYEIRHLGMQDQWAVLLRSTQRVLAKDMKSRDAAKTYINSLRPQSIGR